MSLGPVQLLVVSFDEPRLNGEIMATLGRLRDTSVIRLIDALAVEKGTDGELAVVRWTDRSVEDVQDLGGAIGTMLGLGLAEERGMLAGMGADLEEGPDGALIDESKVRDLTDRIPRGGAAALALIEHVWALPLRDDIVRAGGVPVTSAWVHPRDLIKIGLQSADDVARV
jgi:uncharacterized membrane protein